MYGMMATRPSSEVVAIPQSRCADGQKDHLPRSENVEKEAAEIWIGSAAFSRWRCVLHMEEGKGLRAPHVFCMKLSGGRRLGANTGSCAIPSVRSESGIHRC